MNLKQWQRSKKIKAEAEAAAKRTVERVLNAVKEPAMSEFKVGDWIIDPLIGDKVIKCHDGYLREMKFFGSVIRHATPEEAKAGWREGSKEFDLFWYGQSLGEAIRAHDLLGEELIEGGATFIGNNSNIIQMVNNLGDDSHIENHTNPLCEAKDQ